MSKISNRLTKLHLDEVYKSFSEIFKNSRIIHSIFYLKFALPYNLYFLNS